MSPNYLYTAENEYAPELLHEFGEWYAFRHAPDIFRLGFHSASSYRAVEGGLNVFGIYEIPSPDIFLTPEYRAIGSRDPHRDRIIVGRVSARAHTTYEQHALWPEAGGTPARLDADWISVIRFEAEPASDDALAGFFRSGEGERLGRQGARRMRFGRRKGERPGSVTDRPSCIAVAEWPGRPEPGAATWKGLTDAFGDRLSRISYYTGYRAYPWRDDPAPVS